MLYYILDLEFNQYFDFSDGSVVPEPACPSEIIQMGLIVMDEKLNITSRRETLVKPQIYGRMHPYVHKITGLSMADLHDAPAFPEAYEEFFDFAFGKKAVFCTWGSEDIKELYKNILYYDLNPKALSHRYLNVQKLCGQYLDSSNNQQKGLSAAVADMGLVTDESKPFHNALNDAEYTAEILRVLLKSKKSQPYIKFQNLNMSELKQKISGRVNSVNINLLYTHTERLLKRKLSGREKEAVLEIYNFGRSGKFDTVPGRHNK